MTEASLKSPPAEPRNELNREKVLSAWHPLWADGKNPCQDGTLQPPQKQSILGEYLFSFRPLDETGRYSTIGWILKQAGVADDEIRKMSPYRAIHGAAIFLGAPVAQVALIRAITEVIRPNGAVKEDFMDVIRVIDPWQRLAGFAMQIDSMGASEWEKVEENMAEQQYDWQAVSRRFDILDGRNSEEHGLISHMFEKAAYIDLNRGFQGEGPIYFSEHPLVLAVRNAALEIFHFQELRRRDFPLSSFGLFDI